MISMGIGLASVASAILLPARWVWLAGPLYFLMGPAHGAWGYRSGKRVERLHAKQASIPHVAVTK